MSGMQIRAHSVSQSKIITNSISVGPECRTLECSHEPASVDIIFCSTIERPLSMSPAPSSLSLRSLRCSPSQTEWTSCFSPWLYMWWGHKFMNLFNKPHIKWVIPCTLRAIFWMLQQKSHRYAWLFSLRNSKLSYRPKNCAPWPHSPSWAPKHTQWSSLLDGSRSRGLTWFSPLALDPITQVVKEKNKILIQSLKSDYPSQMVCLERSNNSE